MADEKQMSAVRFFCRKTASSKGNHDWSDLVQQVSYFDFGHIQKDAVAGSSRRSAGTKRIPQRREMGQDRQCSRWARENSDHYSQWAGSLAKSGAGGCIDSVAARGA